MSWDFNPAGWRTLIGAPINAISAQSSGILGQTDKANRCRDILAKPQHLKKFFLKDTSDILIGYSSTITFLDEFANLWQRNLAAEPRDPDCVRWLWAWWVLPILIDLLGYLMTVPKKPPHHYRFPDPVVGIRAWNRHSVRTMVECPAASWRTYHHCHQLLNRVYLATYNHCSTTTTADRPTKPGITGFSTNAKTEQITSS